MGPMASVIRTYLNSDGLGVESELDPLLASFSVSKADMILVICSYMLIDKQFCT